MKKRLKMVRGRDDTIKLEEDLKRKDVPNKIRGKKYKVLSYEDITPLKKLERGISTWILDDPRRSQDVDRWHHIFSP